MIYKYAQIDNRPTPEARAHNDSIFNQGWCGECQLHFSLAGEELSNCTCGSNAVERAAILGIEVTDAALAARCTLGNIDPQHGHSRSPAWDANDAKGQADKAACEVALGFPLPPASSTVVFQRVDLDAVCAAAVLELRASSSEADNTVGNIALGAAVRDAGFHASDYDALIKRIRAVAEADNFVVGKTPWQPYPLPTKENPWPQGASVDSRRELAAINRAVMDRSVPLETKVEWVKTWLLTGKEPTPPGPYSVGCEWCGEAHCECGETDGISDPREHYSYRNEIERERQEIVEALSMGALTDAIDICVVASVSIVSMPGKAYPGATGLGFALAPICVCVADRFQPGDYRKVTIASWGVLSPKQMEAIRDRLNKLEPVWTISHPKAEGEVRPFDEWQPLINRLFFEESQLVKISLLPGALTWGGNLQSGILGSPQGRSTTVTVQHILDAIREVQ